MSTRIDGTSNSTTVFTVAASSDSLTTKSRHSFDDTASSSLRSAASSSRSLPERSLLSPIFDMVNCIPYYVRAVVQKLREWIIPCFQKVKSRPAKDLDQKTTRDAASSQQQADASRLASHSLDLEEPAPPINDSTAFDALPISEENKQSICFILTQLATVNALLLPRALLTQHGASIEDLHPFRFLEYVCKKSNLFTHFQQLRAVSRATFLTSPAGGLIWKQFTEGLVTKLEAQHRQGQLSPYVGAFARSIGRDEQEIQAIIDTRQWLELINYILDRAPSASSATHSSSLSISVSASATAVAASVHRVPNEERSLRHTPSPSRGDPSIPREGSVSPSDRGNITPPAMPVRSTLGNPMSDPAPPSNRPLKHLLPLHQVLSPTSARDMSLALATPNATPSADSLRPPPVTIPRLDPHGTGLNQEENRILSELLGTIAHQHYVSLGFQTWSLRSSWNKLKSVHPLMLLLAVFKDETNIANVRLILADPLKRGPFLGDFSTTLNRSPPLDLQPFILNFEQRLRVGNNVLAGWITLERWSDVIEYLSKSIPDTIGTPS